MKKKKQLTRPKFLILQKKYRRLLYDYLSIYHARNKRDNLHQLGTALIQDLKRHAYDSMFKVLTSLECDTNTAYYLLDVANKARIEQTIIGRLLYT